MRFSFIGRAVTASILAVGASLATLPASAATAPQAAVSPRPMAAVSPMHLVCDPESSFKVTGHTWHFLVKLGPRAEVYNPTSHTVTLGSTLTFGGSVSATISGSVDLSESVIIASSKQTLGASVTGTISGSWSVTGSMSVRAHKDGYLQGGVFRVKVIGQETRIDQNCKVSHYTVTSYLPYAVGYIPNGG